APPAHPAEPRARRGRCRSAPTSSAPGGRDQTVPARSSGPTAQRDRACSWPTAASASVKAAVGQEQAPRSDAMRYVGLDLHKQSVEVCALDATGKRLFRLSVPCQRQALEDFARERLRKEDKVAVEATTNTWAVADILRPFVAAIVVGNPLQIKAIAQAKVKTDKIDAEVLANLLRCNFLPDVWNPDPETQRLRHLTGVRSALIADRTRLKNRIHSLLAGLLIVLPEGGLFTEKGLNWVRKLKLSDDARSTVDRFLRLYDAVEAELESLDVVLRTLAHHDARVRLLMTLPG